MNTVIPPGEGPKQIAPSDMPTFGMTEETGKALAGLVAFLKQDFAIGRRQVPSETVPELDAMERRIVDALGQGTQTQMLDKVRELPERDRSVIHNAIISARQDAGGLEYLRKSTLSAVSTGKLQFNPEIDFMNKPIMNEILVAAREGKKG